MASLIPYLIDWAVRLGYSGIVLIVGPKYACLPIPSKVVLPFGGISIATGEI